MKCARFGTPAIRHVGRMEPAMTYMLLANVAADEVWEAAVFWCFP